MFSKFVGLLRAFGGRIMVGKDKNGNSYYRRPEKVGGAPEKRWVEFKGAPEPTTLPVEWTSWLSGTRKEAPTPQEIMKWEAQRRDIKLQAELIRKKEAKERIRARVTQDGLNAEKGGQEDMEMIMRQIGSEESGSSIRGETKGEKPAHARYTRVRDAKESAEPTTWQPPRQDGRATSPSSRAPEDSSKLGSAAPKGEGEKFKPGTWKP